MERLLNDYGTMKMSQVLAPAINYAYNGWKMNERVYQKINEYRDVLAMFPSSAALYLDPFGQPFKIGTMMYNPDLGYLFELIADYGSSVFYDNTTISKSIIQTIQANCMGTGTMTEHDIQLYRAVYRKPVTWNFANLNFIGPNYPTNGGQWLAESMNILSLLLQENEKWDSVNSLQYVLDAMSLTFADINAYQGDPDFVDGLPMEQLVQMSYAQQRAALINTTRGIINATAGDPFASSSFTQQKRFNLNNYSLFYC